MQAQRLLDGWRDDRRVDGGLVPINPVPPLPFAAALRVKYLRTLVTQLSYWPLLFRELRQRRRRPRVLGVVHVVPPGAAPGGR